MPSYTYRCDNCGHEFDRQQRFSENPLKKCPQCGRMTLNKVYKPARVVFKGPGFYATDHRSSSGFNSSSVNGKSEKSTKTQDKKRGENTKSSEGKSAKSTTAETSKQ
jgi:putative FmdB family regulatory protein